VGHNGLDFELTAGNEVFACDSGTVIQSGVNGDFGTSITVQHSWGQSIYGHLQETKVKEGDEIQVNKVIGLSGSSGAAFGEHLHFAIKPNNPDLNNGYLGFIDPSPYLSLTSQKEEQKQETPPVEEQKPAEEVKQPETTPPVQEASKPEEVPSPIKLEPEKPADQTETPQVSEEEIQKQVDEKLEAELDARRIKANQARQTKREENLMKIEKLIEVKKQINNDDVRELLHVSQSAATNYLQTLVDRGTIKKEGKGKATTYHN
jgi:pyruvate/2-oxoglutarate dehydrogenase complex dihydrolipoamide acyltransferase (E2) component